MASASRIMDRSRVPSGRAERLAKIGALLGAFGDAMGLELPAASTCPTHLWRVARTPQALGTHFLWDVDQRLPVCGDWTRGVRVEDAFTSGELLSRAMLGDQTLPASQA